MKTIIVTGGTGGLGGTVVELLARLYRCVLLYNSTAPSGDNVEGLQADLFKEDSVRAAVQRSASLFGAPYALVHLAGGYAHGMVTGTSTDTWNHMIGLNLTSSFLVIRETMATMRRDAPGRIVAISSEATRTKPKDAAAYAIAKSGLNLLIELTAAELAGSGITANALVPGSLDTPAGRQAMPGARLVPLDQVAEAILFLLSEGAANINGALIPMRG
ncbi:MAG: SDR family NAD(P)-dependent oxidoreductase [Acidobacteriota bacterium]